MKTGVQAGKVVTLAAPYAVAPGDGMLVGAMFGVASSSAASGAEVEVLTEGVVRLTAPSTVTGALGAEVYWDTANRRATTVSPGNALIGYLTAPKANGETTALVRLGVFGSGSMARYALDASGNVVGLVGPGGIEQLASTPLVRRPTALTSDAPTITYGTSVPTSRRVPASPPNVQPVGVALQWNDVNGWYDAVGSGGSMSGIDAMFDGDVLTLGWRCSVATAERFMFYVDGLPVSLTPATPSVSTVSGTIYYVTLTWGAAARRRVEILFHAFNALTGLHVPVNGSISAPARKRTIEIIGDSFNAGSAAVSNNALLPASVMAMTFDCAVVNNSLGGTGYVTDNGGFKRWGDATRVAVTTIAQPDDIVFMGSVNDDGKAGIQAGAEAAIAAHRAAAPSARIRVFGPQPAGATETLSVARRDSCLAVRAAAGAQRAPYHEMVGFVDTSALRSWAAFTFFNPGELITHLGAIWRHEAKVATQYPGGGAPGQPGYAGWTLVTADLYGTGRVSATAGDGPRDIYLHTDSLHPTERACSRLAARMAEAVSYGWRAVPS